MEGFCRGCLNKFSEPSDLLQYCESNRRLFVYCTGLQVKRNDTFTFQLCKDCYVSMRLACQFKKQCRTSDKKLKNYLALNNEGECIDFCTYIKNVEDTLMLRFPVARRSSTPYRHDANDDNESTCTSIQNFMTDMLEGEEMPPTEARIIREVIQEEADILDDSLDSHWLQDDNNMSIHSDFGVDFNLNEFSTPNSINNDHCYTPRRETDDKDDDHYYTTKEPIQMPSKTSQQNDMPILDDYSLKLNDITNADSNLTLGSLETEYCIKKIAESEEPLSTTHSDMPLLDDCNIEFDGIVDNDVTMGELETEICIGNFNKRNKLTTTKNKTQDSGIDQSKVTQISASPFAKLDSFTDGLFSLSNYLSPLVNCEKSITNDETSQDFIAKIGKVNEFSIIINKGVADKQATDSPLTRELEYYMNKVDLKKASSNITVDKNNQETVGKTVEQSPLSHELEQYINKAKHKTKTHLDDKVLNMFKSHDELSLDSKLETYVGNILNQEKSIENLDDSPIKRELESYINKAESKKVNQECTIDKNLELALKNDDNLEFSLDQLLISPQVSIRSGASTPTINSILFGPLTNKSSNKNKDFESNKGMKQDLDPTDFIKEFLKDNDGKCTPKKGIKDMNRLKELILPELHDKADTNGAIGFKDINKLKELLKFVHNDQSSEKSESENLDIVHNDQSSEKSESELESVNDCNDELMEIEDIIEQPVLQEHHDVTSLLNCDENESIDLNFSISSDFLKDEVLDVSENDLPKENSSENNLLHENGEIVDVFKMPFSPPESKYDVENCLCKICDKKYDSERALKIHFVKKHKYQIAKKKKTVVYVPKCCQICGKSFKDKSNLNKHLKRHETDKAAYICEYCTLEFPSQGRLSQHMRAHSKEVGFQGSNQTKAPKKNFICNICGKSSSILANFKVHMRRHTKSYSHTCQLCDKGFYREQDLKQHMVTHGGYTEGFKCQYCPKMYKRRDLLKAHIYRHMNKKEFACEFCNVRFVSMPLLKNHNKTKMCLTNQEKLANEAQEALKENNISVTNAFGPTDKIVQLLQITEENINSENDNGETKESAEVKIKEKDEETKDGSKEKINTTEKAKTKSSGKGKGKTKES